MTPPPISTKDLIEDLQSYHEGTEAYRERARRVYASLTTLQREVLLRLVKYGPMNSFETTLALDLNHLVEYELAVRIVVHGKKGYVAAIPISWDIVTISASQNLTTPS